MQGLISILTPVFPVDEKRPALFLDRDDTLIRDSPYLSKPEGVELLAGWREGLSAFRKAGCRLIMVSNQSGVGRGLITTAQLLAVHARLAELLAEGGVQLDATYYCPHEPQAGCRCRKPGIGMLEAACRDFATDLVGSLMVGDRAGDMEMGLAMGVQCAQFLNGQQGAVYPGVGFGVHSMSEAYENWLLWRRALAGGAE